MLHSSLSLLQVLPIYPGGQLQLNIPVMGLVSQCEPSLQGLLMQASSLWQSKPDKNNMLETFSTNCLCEEKNNKTFETTVEIPACDLMGLLHRNILHCF